MRPDKQCEAIAIACGWEKDGVWNDTGKPAWKSPGQPSHIRHSSLPDYLNDLNAIHEAEKILDVTNGGPTSGDCLRYAYSRHLYTLVPEWMQPFRATAAQRVEAFLKTLGLWED